MFKKILFPMNNNVYSRKAISHVCEMATKFNAQILLLHVFSISPELPYFIEGIRDYTIKGANTFLQEMEKEFQDKKMDIETSLKEGNAGPIIVETIEKEKCDLVIMGSRRESTVKNLLLGSVSNYVIHHTECPIFIIH